MSSRSARASIRASELYECEEREDSVGERAYGELRSEQERSA
jgi:hypothetical protein